MESGNLVSKEKLKTKQNKLKNKFENIKSNYILQMIFNNLGKKKSLNIVKCNNYIKKRIDININDYKEYYELYSSIEIEIKPVNNKYDKFINNPDKDKKYYHIYFNNSKEEIKRNYLDDNEKV